MKPDILIYLHLLPPIALVFKERRSGRNTVLLMNLHSHRLSDKRTQNTSHEPLIAGLSDVWHIGYLDKGPTHSKCECSHRLSDSDEKCVPVRWLTPEQPRPAGSTAPNLRRLRSQSCAARQTEASPLLSHHYLMRSGSNQPDNWSFLSN